MPKNLHHVDGCNRKSCWIDASGVEWHRGNFCGVYRIFNGEVVFLNESALPVTEVGSDGY